ncbi:DinB family protein [Paenibacillus albiflavus]|uniref:DinB family protein n=1 Tax=Paenibacillus albiflavus TaxID=2545760 RepID=A0A4R4EMC0_9BACL|nr:DinB family protein [Paenibacillus albiflavus]TCZ80967.1 DinB family protein [Paenibacillus albiflavus]
MDIVTRLELLIKEIPSMMDTISDEDFNKKHAKDKWSKKEILGHLCDSATNNHMRFVKIMLSEGLISCEAYLQNQWVSIHDYQNNYSKSELTALWKQLNLQIYYTLKGASENDFNKQCILPNQSIVTLEWLFTDYIEHMVHHMKQIEGK